MSDFKRIRDGAVEINRKQVVALGMCLAASMGDAKAGLSYIKELNVFPDLTDHIHLDHIETCHGCAEATDRLESVIHADIREVRAAFMTGFDSVTWRGAKPSYDG